MSMIWVTFSMSIELYHAVALILLEFKTKFSRFTNLTIYAPVASDDKSLSHRAQTQNFVFVCNVDVHHMQYYMHASSNSLYLSLALQTFNSPVRSGIKTTESLIQALTLTIVSFYSSFSVRVFFSCCYRRFSVFLCVVCLLRRFSIFVSPQRIFVHLIQSTVDNLNLVWFRFHLRLQTRRSWKTNIRTHIHRTSSTTATTATMTT